MKKFTMAAAAASLMVLSACGGEAEEAEKPQPEDRNEVRLEGADAKLPEGMPEMPGMRIDRSDAYDFDNKGRRRLSVKFYVKDTSSKDIAEFYGNAMKEKGMTVSTRHSDSSSNARGEDDAGWISVTSPTKPNSKAQEGETYAVMMQDFAIAQ